MIAIGGHAMALALLAAGAPPAQGPWILTCSASAPDRKDAPPGAQRVFRIGPQLFQEWKPAAGQFGPNLCQSFSCVADKGQLQGEISSAALTVIVSLDPAAGRGSWRTIGASGLSTSNGPCSVKLDKDAAPTPASAADKRGR